MMGLFGLLALTLAAPLEAAGLPPPPLPGADRLVQSVDLTDETIAVLHEYKVAPSLPITFDLPEAFKSVLCGDCANPGEQAGGHAFQLIPNKLNTAVTLRLLPKAVTRKIETSLDIELQSYGRVKLLLVATNNSFEATKNVTFHPPGLNDCAIRLRSQHEADWKLWSGRVSALVQDQVTADLASSMLTKEPHCRGLKAGVNEDGYRADVLEICGIAGKLLLRYQVELKLDEPITIFSASLLFDSKPTAEQPTLAQVLSAKAATTGRPLIGVVVVKDDPTYRSGRLTLARSADGISSISIPLELDR